MKILDLHKVEAALKQRWQLPYEWGKKQNDEWDRLSSFIYREQEWGNVRRKCELLAGERKLPFEAFYNYAANRWYNFWSAMAVESIFLNLEKVTPARNSKDRLVDFYINGINFDLKTSVFPRQFGKNLQDAREQPVQLIEWLYQNQSSQQRQHFSNRLFLIVHSRDGQHWKLKAEISWLKGIIENYVTTFEPSQLKSLKPGTGKAVLSDIIWAVQ